MQALKAVAAFSRKTGDFASLSCVDLRVLALTYSLEVLVKGNAAHLRTEPKRIVPAGSGAKSGGNGIPSKATKQQEPSIEGFGAEPSDASKGVGGYDEEEVIEYEEEEDDDEEEEEEEEEENLEKEELQREVEQTLDESTVGSEELVIEERQFADLKLTVAAEVREMSEGASAVNSGGLSRSPPIPTTGFSWADAVKKAPIALAPMPSSSSRTQAKGVIPVVNVAGSTMDKAKEDMEWPVQVHKPEKPIQRDHTSRFLGASVAAASSDTRGADDDDGQGWINTCNIGSVKGMGGGFPGKAISCVGDKIEEAGIAVGCITTDFAMQNVLLQVRCSY